MKRVIAFVLCLFFLLTLIGCRTKEKPKQNLSFSSVSANYGASFQTEDASERLHITSEKKNEFLDYLSSVYLPYEYSELYGVEECYDRIFTDVSVASHQYSALDQNGKLTAAHLAEVVKQNNRDYLESERYGTGMYVELDDDFLLSVCELITDTISEIYKRYPDINYDRVYCNLGRLRIFYKKALLDNAQVTVDMMMLLSNNMLDVVNIMAGDNGTRDTVIHEIMHIIQLGCSCESIDNCTRRAGITHMWDDTKFDGGNWSWFFEGSAEQVMTLITGDDPIVYKNKINYIKSLDLATFLEDDISANYAESISFYDDPYKLFNIFFCSDKRDITEVAYMMKAIDIIQESPDDFLEAYAQNYGVDIEDDAVLDQLRISLKPAICVTLSKTFYRNLANVLSENEGITANDLCYLLRVFEATMEYHMVYSDSSRDEVNAPFLIIYREMRNKLFNILGECGTEFDIGYYEAYEMFTDLESTAANASFRWLDKDKQTFLLERTEFLSSKLKVKIS